MSREARPIYHDRVIRVRCYSKLVARLERIAAAQRRPWADFFRIVLEDYADAREKELGLPPLPGRRKPKH